MAYVAGGRREMTEPRPGRTARAASQAMLEAPQRVLGLDEHDGITVALFRDLALREQAFHSRALCWACDLHRLPDLGSALASGRNDYSEAALIRRGQVIVHARVDRSGHAQIRLAAPQRALLEPVEAWLRQLLPQPARTPESSCARVRFWYHAPDGASSSSRELPVPRWEEIRGNYAARTRDPLELLMSAHQPDSGGQLLLWHGPAGTGKTFALRALLWQWREWCDADFIIDPDIFFGARPDYMVHVILEHEEADDAAPADEHAAQATRWRLLILEDTGELLSADAKERAGQGLSRLLNVVDGLIGQGLRLLILMTGNEPLQRLHPALARPGRCRSLVEFLPLDEAEASEWLTSHQAPPSRHAGATVAQLFATLNGQPVAPAERRPGFA